MKVNSWFLLVLTGLVFFKAVPLFASIDFKQDYFREPEAIDSYKFNGSKDKNNDGKPDEISYCDDKMEFFIEDTDFDGRVNRISYFENGILLKVEEDVDQDGEWDYTYFWKAKKTDKVAGAIK